LSPEEILQDLRDVHLPAETALATGSGIVLWPLVLVFLITLIGVWIAWRRRSSWRRDFYHHLDVINEEREEETALEDWAKLAILLRRTAIQLSGRREIAGLIGDAWLEKLDHLFSTDAFSKGPGQGVIRFPYRRSNDIKENELGPMAEQLEAIIGHLRQSKPRQERP